MKKCISVISICILCVLITGCGISNSELDESNKQFEKAVIELCEEYELNDCTIEITEFSKIDDYYIASAYIYSDDFVKLESNQAYFFAKELNDLEYDIETKNSDFIGYSERIISNDSRYYYDERKDIHYLMKDFESVYTIRNGQVMYDIFKKGY